MQLQLRQLAATGLVHRAMLEQQLGLLAAAAESPCVAVAAAAAEHVEDTVVADSVGAVVELAGLDELVVAAMLVDIEAVAIVSVLPVDAVAAAAAVNAVVVPHVA